MWTMSNILLHGHMEQVSDVEKQFLQALEKSAEEYKNPFQEAEEEVEQISEEEVTETSYSEFSPGFNNLQENP